MDARNIERLDELEDRVRALELWRAEHDKWASEKEGTLEHNIEEVDGLESRIRMMELWKVEQSTLAPTREKVVTEITANVEQVKNIMGILDKKLARLQWRVFLLISVATGLAVFLAKVSGDVVGGVILKRLLSITSVPPTVP